MFFVLPLLCHSSLWLLQASGSQQVTLSPASRLSTSSSRPWTRRQALARPTVSWILSCKTSRRLSIRSRRPTQAAQKDTLCHVAMQCQLSTQAFLDENAMFKESLGLQPSVSVWRVNLHKLQWVLRKDRAINKLRSDIEAHTTTLYINLTTSIVSAIMSAQCFTVLLEANSWSCRSTASLRGEALDNCRNDLHSVQLNSRESNVLAKINHQSLTSQSAEYKNTCYDSTVCCAAVLLSTHSGLLVSLLNAVISIPRRHRSISFRL